MLSTAVIEGEDEIKRLNKMNIEYRDRLKHSKERKEQQEIVEQAKLVAEKYKLLKSEMKTSKELLSEFKFMKKVHSIDDLKKIVKTCEFWADTWAISTLERVLNIKLVIFLHSIICLILIRIVSSKIKSSILCGLYFSINNFVIN